MSQAMQTVFETWVKREYENPWLEKNQLGDYLDDEIFTRWTVWQAATEATKATGTAELPPPDYVAGTKGMLCEDTWARETVKAYGHACAEAAKLDMRMAMREATECAAEWKAKAEAARQPAPVTEKKLSDTIKSVLTPEDFGILDPELAKRAINFSNAMVHQAALAATAAPVLSVK